MNVEVNYDYFDYRLGITVPKPNSRIMDIFTKNLFEVVKCTQTKNLKNQILNLVPPSGQNISQIQFS